MGGPAHTDNVHGPTHNGPAHSDPAYTGPPHSDPLNDPTDALFIVALPIMAPSPAHLNK